MSSFPAVASWSGGKDSCLACYRALRSGVDIRYLLNFISREYRRCCFHGIPADLIRLQADAIGIPLLQAEVSPDMQKYEEEFKAAVSGLQQKGIGRMVFGDIYLLERTSWVERVSEELGIEAVLPLWNSDPQGLLEEFLALGFEAVIVSCQADKLGREFIGRRIDGSLLAEFKSRGICPCGENGEYHTFVTDGPLFKKRIEITESEVVLKEGFWKHWFLDIRQHRVIDKALTTTAR